MKNVLLFLAYLALFAPAGALARLARDPLRRRVQRAAPSYWETAP